MDVYNKYSKEYTEGYIKNLGYKIIKKDNKVDTCYDKMVLEDDNGYNFYINFHDILRNIKRGSPFRIVGKSNPFSFDNISVWIRNNNLSYKIKEKSFYVDKKNKSLILVCNICKNEWETNWDNINSGRGCPFCAHIRVARNNSFGSNYPELMDEWDYTKNTQDPYEYAPQSTKKVWWICSICKYEWCTSSASRTARESGCPACSGHKPSENNNFAFKHPELLSEWDYDRNAKSPYDYTPSSDEMVWWVCLKCGNSWDSIIKSRANGCGCPFCNGKRVDPINSLAEKYPLLVSEWDYEKNSKKPYEYTPYSNKKVYWKCLICGNSWKAIISKRTMRGQGCPHCSSSNGEKAISRFFMNNNIIYIPQFRIDDCKNINALPFDFYLPYYNVLAEYQGEQHYQVLSNHRFGGESELIERKKHDLIKFNYCESNNIPFLIIPYWDFSRIPEILTEYLNL